MEEQLRAEEALPTVSESLIHTVSTSPQFKGQSGLAV